MPPLRPDIVGRGIRTALGLDRGAPLLLRCGCCFLLAIAALFIWPLAILAVVYGLAALRTFSEQKDRHQSVQKGRWMAVTAVAVSVVLVPFVVYGVVFV